MRIGFLLDLEWEQVTYLEELFHAHLMCKCSSITVQEGNLDTHTTHTHAYTTHTHSDTTQTHLLTSHTHVHHTRSHTTHILRPHTHTQTPHIPIHTTHTYSHHTHTQTPHRHIYTPYIPLHTTLTHTAYTHTGDICLLPWLITHIPPVPESIPSTALFMWRWPFSLQSVNFTFIRSLLPSWCLEFFN